MLPPTDMLFPTDVLSPLEMYHPHWCAWRCGREVATLVFWAKISSLFSLATRECKLVAAREWKHLWVPSLMNLLSEAKTLSLLSHLILLWDSDVYVCGSQRRSYVITLKSPKAYVWCCRKKKCKSVVGCCRILHILNPVPSTRSQWLLKSRSPWAGGITHQRPDTNDSLHVDAKDGCQIFAWICSWFGGNVKENIPTAVEEKVKMKENLAFLFLLIFRSEHLDCCKIRNHHFAAFKKGARRLVQAWRNL